MVDVKISGLPNAAALTGNEAIPAVQGGSNVKVLVSAIRAGMASDDSVVHTTGDEAIGGVKTFTANSNWNLSANGRIIYGEPGGDSAGISLFRGDWNAGSARRSDIRARSGDLLLGCGSASDNTAPVNWVSIGPAHVRPTIPGTLNLGTSGNAWLNTFTAELTLTGDSAAKARSRAGIQAVGLLGNETVAGDKTWSGIHTWNLASAGSVQYGTPTGLPGIIIRNGDPTGGSGALWRSDIRGGAGFCNIVVNNIAGDNTSAARGISLQQTALQPTNNNLLSLGAPSALWTQVHASNASISTSDARLKTPLQPMTDAEEAAFLEIIDLPMKWRWLDRIAEEGEEARWHAGPAVQAAAAVMEKHGLAPFDYSAFCYDSWPAKAEVWREWPAQEAEVVEWPAVPETWADIPAEVDEAGEIVVPARRELVHEAVPAGRVVLKEAVEAGRELIQSAVEAGDRYSFRVSELQAWILAATARRDRREREAAELRMASIEQRLAALEAG
ncbi:TPA: tail fiber domain-containing protein, partial [Stenotrophomonas maltophilia]